MGDFNFKEFILEIVDDVRQLSARSTNAMKFWYTIAYLAYIGLWVMFPLVGCLLSVILSFALFLVFLKGYENNEIFWGPMSLAFWFAIVYVGVISFSIRIGMFLYNTIFIHFNNWLNRL